MPKWSLSSVRLSHTKAIGKIITLVGLGLLSLSAALLFESSSAHAQYYGWQEQRYYDGPDDYPRRPRFSDPPSMSLADVRQRVAEQGMHLIATPRRKGRIYLAEVEDARGIRHRLVFDVFEGRLIENTVLGPKSPIPGPSVLPQPIQHPGSEEASKTEPAASKPEKQPEKKEHDLLPLPDDILAPQN